MKEISSWSYLDQRGVVVGISRMKHHWCHLRRAPLNRYNLWRWLNNVDYTVVIICNTDCKLLISKYIILALKGDISLLEYVIFREEMLAVVLLVPVLIPPWYCWFQFVPRDDDHLSVRSFVLAWAYATMQYNLKNSIELQNRREIDEY